MCEPKNKWYVFFNENALPFISLVVSVLLCYEIWAHKNTEAELTLASDKLGQLAQRLENIQPAVSQLKADKKELRQALIDCNFLRVSDSLPLTNIDPELVKAVSTYSKLEANVINTLVKYGD